MNIFSIDNIKAFLVYLKNSVFALRYLLSNNNLNFFPKYPSFFLPVFTTVQCKDILGFISIANKPGKGKNCVADINREEIISIKNLFFQNPKFITAKQILCEGTSNIYELDEYKFYIKMLNENGSARGMLSEEEIRKNMRNRIQWYKNIQNDGYIFQAKSNFDYNCEVHVLMLDENKYLKVNSGNHRHAAYEILQIDKFQAHPVAFDRKFLEKFGSIKGYKVLRKLRRIIEKNKQKC